LTIFKVLTAKNDFLIKNGEHYIVPGRAKALKTDDKPQAFTLEIVGCKPEF